MATVIVKLIYNDKIKLLKSEDCVSYQSIHSVCESLVQPYLPNGCLNVLFKNDKEYPIARSHIDKVPVIVIPIIVDNSNNYNDNSLTLHDGVICDVCDNEIAGIRYKCIVCEDYDLCQLCEGNNDHDLSHVMLRFAHPANNMQKVLLNDIHQHLKEDKVFEETDNDILLVNLHNMSDSSSSSSQSSENDSDSSYYFSSSDSDCTVVLFGNFDNNSNSDSEDYF